MRLPELTTPGPQVLWVLPFLATRQGLPQPLAPPQMPAGPFLRIERTSRERIWEEERC